MTIKNKEEKILHASPMIMIESPNGYKLHFSASLSLDQLSKLFKLSGWDNA